MADWDAIGALADGIKQGLITYKDVKKDQEDRAVKQKLMKFQLAEKGYQETPTGDIVETQGALAKEAEKKTNEDRKYKAGLLEHGYQEDKTDPTGFKMTGDEKEKRYFDALGKTANFQTQGLMLPAALGAFQSPGKVAGGKADVESQLKQAQIKNIGETSDRANKQLGLMAQRYGFENQEAPSGFEKTDAQKAKEALDADKTRADIELKKASAGKASRSGTGKDAKPTAGQIAVDKDYAKDYVDWSANGGYANVQKNLVKLKDASERLGKTNSATGPMLGLLPKTVRDIVTPSGAAIQDDVDGVIIQSAKQIFPRITQAEVKLLLDNAYNPRLGEAENNKRVDATYLALTKAAQAKDAAANYFQQKGTLTGYKGPQPDISSIIGTASSGPIGGSSPKGLLNKPAPQSGPKVGSVENGYRFKGGNPADQKAWEKVK